jgi:DNA-binding CsgD family transcriptional regulator
MKQPNLTPRETEVLALLKLGQSDKEIAAALNISVETVKNHVRQLRRKFAVSSRRAFMNVES